MPADMAGSMYLSRLTEFKNQKTKNAEQDHIQSRSSEEEQETSSPNSIRAREKQPYNNTRATHFVPREMNPSNIEYSEPASPMRLNQYGVPEVIPSDLGDSFAQGEPWMPKQDEEDEELQRPEGMLGLLNQFYDLNNNPTV
jgi:hypothetical protein